VNEHHRLPAGRIGALALLELVLGDRLAARLRHVVPLTNAVAATTAHHSTKQRKGCASPGGAAVAAEPVVAGCAHLRRDGSIWFTLSAN
jgi:hypothetical protein